MAGAHDEAPGRAAPLLSAAAVTSSPPSRRRRRRLASRHLALALRHRAGFRRHGILIAVAGKNPLVAYSTSCSARSAAGTAIVVGLNKAAPYMLAGVGVALCFRGNVANMGAEGQIAMGGLAAPSWRWSAPDALGASCCRCSRSRPGVLGGAAWAAIAAAINLTRGVHEVLVTLMMNFIGWLIVAEFLHGRLGEIDAGFPQTPMFENVAWLPKLVARTDLHIGIVIAVLAASLRMSCSGAR